jgi:hypothetical protein
MMRRMMGLLVSLWIGASAPAMAEVDGSDSAGCCVRLAALSSPTESILRPSPPGVAIDATDDDLGMRLRLVAMIARLQDELDQFPAFSRWWYANRGLSPIRFPLR